MNGAGGRCAASRSVAAPGMRASSVLVGASGIRRGSRVGQAFCSESKKTMSGFGGSTLTLDFQ